MGLFNRKKTEPSETKHDIVKKKYITELASDKDAEQSPRSEYIGSFVERVKPEWLEFQYMKDPITFNGCNIISGLVGSEGYILNGEDRDKKTVEQFLTDINQEDLAQQIGLHLCLYGRTFGEILLTKDKTAVAGLYLLDPKRMDYKKKQVAGKWLLDLDDFNRPKGYVQHKADWDGNDPNQGIQYRPEEIIQFTMRRLGDSLDGVGLIEPQYKNTHEKINIEEALAEAIWRIGFPLLIQYCGDMEHEPGPQDIKDSNKKLKKVYNKTVLSLPYYRKLELLTTKIENMAENLKHYIRNQVAAFGLPEALLLGTGEGTNRATLTELTSIGAKHLANIHSSIARGYSQKIFSRMLGLGQITKPVTITFQKLKSDERYQQVDSITKLLDSGAITATPELEAHILQMLDLPENKGEFAPPQPKAQAARQLGLDLMKDDKPGRHY
jgi:hypothetical protein